MESERQQQVYSRRPQMLASKDHVQVKVKVFVNAQQIVFVIGPSALVFLGVPEMCKRKSKSLIKLADQQPARKDCVEASKRNQNDSSRFNIVDPRCFRRRFMTR